MSEDSTTPRMSVGEHLNELRSRVIRAILFLAAGLVVCLIFNDYVMGVILRQPYQVLLDLGYEKPRMLALTPTEGFITWLKLALFAALIISSPLMAWQIWGFISAGLYPHEKKYIRLFAPLSYVLFLAGIAFLYFAVMPTALRFLLSFGLSPAIPGLPEGERLLEATPQFGAFISFYVTMSVIMGIVFQLPLVMLFLMATRIVKPAFFAKYRRHFVVGAVAVLAVLTPTGDALTLVIVTAPVLLLYEMGLLMGRIVLRRRAA